MQYELKGSLVKDYNFKYDSKIIDNNLKLKAVHHTFQDLNFIKKENYNYDDNFVNIRCPYIIKNLEFFPCHSKIYSIPIEPNEETYAYNPHIIFSNIEYSLTKYKHTFITVSQKDMKAIVDNIVNRPQF